MPTTLSELPYREDVLFKLQQQTEEWLRSATAEQILERLGLIHGLLQEDIPELDCGQWNNTDGNFGVASKCPRCDYFIQAWETIANTVRPELKYLR